MGRRVSHREIEARLQAGEPLESVQRDIRAGYAKDPQPTPAIPKTAGEHLADAVKSATQAVSSAWKNLTREW